MDLSGRPCKIINSDIQDPLNSKLICEIEAPNTDKNTVFDGNNTVLYGNRGIDMIEDQLYTSIGNNNYLILKFCLLNYLLNYVIEIFYRPLVDNKTRT